MAFDGGGNASTSSGRRDLGSLSPASATLASFFSPGSQFAAGPQGIQFAATPGTKGAKKQLKRGQQPFQIDPNITEAIRLAGEPRFGGLRGFEEFALNDLPEFGQRQMETTGFDTLEDFNQLFSTLPGVLSSFASTGLPQDIDKMVADATRITDPLEDQFLRTLDREILPQIGETVGNAFSTDVSAQGLAAGVDGLTAIKTLTSDIIQSDADRSLLSLDSIGGALGSFLQAMSAPFQASAGILGTAQAGRDFDFANSPEGAKFLQIMQLLGLDVQSEVVGKQSASAAGGTGAFSPNTAGNSLAILGQAGQEEKNTNTGDE
jgi:hypothetical protein